MVKHEDLPDLLVLHIFFVLEGHGFGAAALLVDVPRSDTILLDLSEKRPSIKSSYDRFLIPIGFLQDAALVVLPFL